MTEVTMIQNVDRTASLQRGSRCGKASGIGHARRRSRQSAYVLTRPMGSNAGRELVATATELSVPLAAGVLLALPFSLVVLAIAVPRFDTLRQLPPPARLVVDVPSLLAALAIAAVAVVVLAAVATAGVVRARPMKVMRSGA